MTSPPLPSPTGAGPADGRLRRAALGALVAVLVQAGVGMAVNLDVTIPSRHPGRGSADYLTGSAASVAWAIGHGAPALVVHAALGLALVVMALAVTVRAFREGGRAARVWAGAGALLVVGAGFNGASFLDYNHDVSSLVMALLAFGAVGCYGALLFVAPAGGAREGAGGRD